MPPARPGGALRALVIGDPGDPAAGLDLPGARHEALAVTRLLRERLGQANVDALIGAPSVARTGDLRDVPPADWLDVLDLLTRGGYDLVHYAGHGDFDPVDPTRAGWLFAGGLITSGEIERLDEVPAIVVANACLSSQTARTEAAEAALLPSIADEFFKLGVRNYIGTAWEVNDLGAERFATDLLRRAPARVGPRGVVRRGGARRPEGAVEGRAPVRRALGGVPALRGPRRRGRPPSRLRLTLAPSPTGRFGAPRASSGV